MISVDDVINTSKDVREVKRALSVKMLQHGRTPAQIGSLLNVSIQYVSKWKAQYEAQGAVALSLAYTGKEKYITPHQEQEIIQWIQAHKTLAIAQLIEHITHTYNVTYKSKQSYYDLLDRGDMSYHRSEKANPKYNAAKV